MKKNSPSRYSLRVFSMILLISLLLSNLSFLGHTLPVRAQDAQADATPTPTETPPESLTAPAGPNGEPQPGEVLGNALQVGEYPAQLVSSMGSITANRYGPQRNDPSQGIPDHAYSPFAEENNREHPCPPGGCDFDPGKVLVKMAPNLQVSDMSAQGMWTTDTNTNQVLAAQGVLTLEPIFPNAEPPGPGALAITPDGSTIPMPDLTLWYRASLPADANVLGVVEELEQNEGIEIALPDYLRKPVGSLDGNLNSYPNAPERQPSALDPITDPLYAQQWHLSAVNAPAAWQWLSDNGYEPGGNRDIVVAVIDTGVDYTHPDLAANMWVNAPEFNGTPGVDDDGNGYVDDVYGADTVYPDGDPQDDHGHGTHVAGIIAAQEGNGIGGVGVAYNVQIMAIKAAQYSGVLSSSDIAEAIYYAVEKGADVINMSFGGYARSQVEEDALAVAFGQAVLVGAAGNDAKVNLPCPFGRDMYPAAYNWVLGVMASTSGGGKASFSNYDCTPHDTHEYELMAPGVDVWSTLPFEGYAAWDGTSMAAPVVSGIAALARTKWADKDVYSSRFIMGQISANTSGGVADAYAALNIAPEPELKYLEHWLFDTTAQDPDNDDDGVVDAGEVIDLAIVIRNHWGKADPVSVKLEAWAEGAVQADPYVTMITDTVDYGAVGSFNWDDNGLIYDEEGVITGVRHPFQFSVDPDTPNDHVIPFRLTITAENGYDPDDPNAPYVFQSRFYLIVQRARRVPWIVSEDMTLTKDDYWYVFSKTLVEEGVVLTITEGTQIQFGGPNPDDPYSGSGSGGQIWVEGEMNILGTQDEPVELFPWAFLPAEHRGVEIFSPNRLEYTKVIDPKFTARIIDHSYFVRDATNVVQMGARYMANSIFENFGTSYYRASIQSDYMLSNLIDGCNFVSSNNRLGGGNVFLKGGPTRDDYFYYTTSLSFPGTRLYPDQLQSPNSAIQWMGHTYVLVSPGFMDIKDKLAISRNFSDSIGGQLVKIETTEENAFLSAQFGNVLIGLFNFDQDGVFTWDDGTSLNYQNWAIGQPSKNKNFYEAFVQLSTNGQWDDLDIQNSSLNWIVEIPSELSSSDIDLAWQTFQSSGQFNGFVNNAFLNTLWDPAMKNWLYVNFGSHDRDLHAYLEDNFWGTTSTTLIDRIIDDKQNNWDYGLYHYQPVQVEPSEDAYPFAWDIILSTASDPNASVVGSELVTFTVLFNRDMDISIQPTISFGPDIPETDYTIHPIDGGWQDPRTWTGTFDVNPITGDGYQLMRVTGAVAADDPWLVTGDDSERFRFEIITSGTEAMNLQATGGEGYVDLSWTQDDFDLLAGYNLYRSTSQDGTYTRLNQGLIPSDKKAYRDTDVQPGQPYYYKFTVVKSDMSESDFSNTATATPTDTIPPVITHTPLTSAPPGLALSLSADVTDNVGVQGVSLYYRQIGDTSYLTTEMVKTTGDRYSATIEGSNIQSPGLEYYIEATDGISTVRSGRPEYPHQVIVIDKPVVTSVTPDHGPDGGGTAVTISGSNFKAGASVTFGGAVSGDVVVDSSSQISCTTPAHFPETVDVVVTNPDTQSGTLLRGFTYESENASLSLPDTNGGQNAIVQIPVNVANLHGLAAVDLTVTFNDSVLDARGASTGNLIPGWSVFANTGTAGEISVSMASTSGTVTGSGVLVLLEFEVVGSSGANTVLHIDSVLLNNGAIPTETADGSFQVNLVYDVSGSVLFWNGSAGIQNTLLTLSGDRIYTDLSDASGAYSVSGVPVGDYTLTPSKSGESDGITAYDASLVLQHSTGASILTGNAATAGDVNKDGLVNSMDAFYILQKAVGLISLPFQGAGMVWDFDPQSRSYTNLSSNQTGQNFTAVLLGDPSGNWGGSGAAGMATDQSVVALNIPDTRVQPNEQVVIPLTASDTQGQFSSADIQIEYDPAKISILSVDAGDLTSEWMIATNTGKPGLLRVSLAGPQPLASDGEILQLRVQVISTEEGVSSLTITQGDLDEGIVAADLQGGQLQIVIPTFSDVSIHHALYDYVEALWDGGFTAGCSTEPLKYCPEQTMNRGMSAVFMLRGNFGTDYAPPAAPWDSFGDDWSLSDISWSEKWAEGMWEEGLTAGCQAPGDPLSYCPRRELPRVEASVFGLRMMHGVDYVPPAASGDFFADMTDPGYWGTKWAEQAYLDGLLLACGEQDGKPLFCPDELVDRSWGAYLIVKAKDLPVVSSADSP